MPDTAIPLVTVKTVLMNDLYVTDPPWPVMARRYLQGWLMPSGTRNPCAFVAHFSLSLN